TAAASLRRRTRNLSSTLWTWFLTVGSSICSRTAISLFDKPSPIRPTTSRSRAVKVVGTGDASRSRATAPTRRSSAAAIRREHSADAGRGADNVVAAIAAKRLRQALLIQADFGHDEHRSPPTP